MSTKLEMDDENYKEPKGKTVKISEPKLDPIERLYVRAYLTYLSHLEAHRFVEPSLKKHHHKNKFSERENVNYHISKGFLEKQEALSMSQEVILEKLFKEATREGYGANHAARVTALTTLGKHFGLFEDKKDEAKGSVINIINYSPTELKETETKVLEEQIVEEVPTNINLTNYEDEYAFKNSFTSNNDTLPLDADLPTDPNSYTSYRGSYQNLSDEGDEGC